MIEALLPGGVATWEVTDDPPDAELLPSEVPLVSRAVEKRRREFTTGRYCARQALGKLGVSPGPILRGQRGEPLWPDGIVGSITHCAGYRAAAVAWSAEVPTLGIDAEPHEPLPAGVLAAIALPQERTQIHQLARSHPDVCWDRLLFSAKEALYKAWYPRTHRFLDFTEATIELAPTGTCRPRVLVPDPLPALSGRWTITHGLVLTSVSPAPGHSGAAVRRGVGVVSDPR